VERALGQRFRFVELANDINSHMPDYVLRRPMLALNKRGRPVSGSRILLLGLAYKKNAGDARELPAVRYGSRISLADQGNLDVAGESGAFVEPS
jgi:UDP-N-acetyl-D-glucosamine dehydrogenase